MANLVLSLLTFNNVSNAASSLQQVCGKGQTSYHQQNPWPPSPSEHSRTAAIHPETRSCSSDKTWTSSLGTTQIWTLLQTYRIIIDPTVDPASCNNRHLASQTLHHWLHECPATHSDNDSISSAQWCATRHSVNRSAAGDPVRARLSRDTGRRARGLSVVHVCPLSAIGPSLLLPPALETVCLNTSAPFLSVFRGRLKAFWPTVLSVAPLLQHVVCRLSVCL